MANFGATEAGESEASQPCSSSGQQAALAWGSTRSPGVKVAGVIVSGHRVASGQASNSPYPQGTIAMQLPHFQQRGLDLSALFPGTLNISVAPWVPRLAEPELTFACLKWSPNHPAETFSFSACQIEARGQRHSGWIYYPHPETKPAHFQPATTLEVLAPWIDGLHYGDSIDLWLNPEAFHLTQAAG